MNATAVICTREEAQYKKMHIEMSYHPKNAKLNGGYLNMATCLGLLAVSGPTLVGPM